MTEKLSYAVRELNDLLSTYTTAEIVKEDTADAIIKLRIDQNLEPHWYRLEGDGKVLTISGGNVSSVLCGIYEGLADAGILFEANGHSLRGTFDMAVFLNSKKEVRPKCRFRGIRQHINFTMDISSYALKEAKEYIRNLARMRYNAITFHSYPGQWHGVNPGEYAGHFFYGQTHPVPTYDPVVRERIHNRKIYCIPEVEAIYEDEALRSEYAKYWLNEVMEAAKEAGLTVTLSVELAHDEEEKISVMLHEVCKTYPRIDNIELISYENFGEGGEEVCKGLTRENMNELIAGMLGSQVLDADGNLEGISETYTAMQCATIKGGAVYLKRVLTALNAREKWLAGLEKQPQIRAGLYMTNKDVLKVLCPLMKKVLPKEIVRCLLPAHGSLAAAENIAYSRAEKEGGWQNTMFYSWAEFDGNMFIQQQSSDGIEKLMFMSEDESIYGFCINHWRTAENSMAISYAAEAAIQPLPALEFYRNYAKKIGIGDEETFAQIEDRMAKLDIYCRDELFNIGFCVIGCWLAWHRENGRMKPRGYAKEPQNYAISEYEAIKAAWEQILPSAYTEEAIAWIRLMINRCETSMLFIRSMLVLEDLHQIYDYSKGEEPTDEQCQKAKKILTQARSYAEEYVRLYSELMPDRGVEGQIASFCETTLVYIDEVAATFEKNRGESSEMTFFDLPPMPSEEGKK